MTSLWASPAVRVDVLQGQRAAHIDIEDAELLVAADGMVGAVNGDVGEDTRQFAFQGDVGGERDGVGAVAGWAFAARFVGVGRADGVGEGAVFVQRVVGG